MSDFAQMRNFDADLTREPEDVQPARNDISAAEIVELERLDQAATSEWYEQPERVNDIEWALPLVLIRSRDGDMVAEVPYPDADCHPANTALVVAARNALPRLIARIRQLGAEVERVALLMAWERWPAEGKSGDHYAIARALGYTWEGKDDYRRVVREIVDACYELSKLGEQVARRKGQP